MRIGAHLSAIRKSIDDHSFSPAIFSAWGGSMGPEEPMAAEKIARIPKALRDRASTGPSAAAPALSEPIDGI